MTLKVRAGLPLLRLRSLVESFERSLAGRRERAAFRVVEYSIQSDHAHFVIEADTADDLAA